MNAFLSSSDDRPISLDSSEALATAHDVGRGTASSGPPSDWPVVLHTRVVTGRGGGPEKTILNSPRFLAELGYQGICTFMHPPGDPGFDEIRRRGGEFGAPVESVPDRGFWDVRVARDLLRICRERNVAIWHAHDYKSNALGLLLRRFHRMRLVTTVHGWVKRTRRTPLYYWIDRRCLPRYDRVLCVSEDLVEQSHAAGVSPDRTVLIRNAIDTSRFRRRGTQQAAREALGLPATGLIVGGAGRLSEEKAFDVLIEAVGRLIACGVEVTLAIAGEGDDRRRIEHVIASQPGPGRFHLLGHVSNMEPFYEALDVFALSSLREGLPNVVLEAMAFAVPVVATSVAGVPDVISDRRNGLIVAPGSVDSLAEAIARLAADADLRCMLGRSGRMTVESQFDLAARMARVAEVYEQVLSDERLVDSTRRTGSARPVAGESPISPVGDVSADSPV